MRDSCSSIWERTKLKIEAIKCNARKQIKYHLSKAQILPVELLPVKILPVKKLSVKILPVKILRNSVFCKFGLIHGIDACHYEVLEGKGLNGEKDQSGIGGRTRSRSKKISKIWIKLLATEDECYKQAEQAKSSEDQRKQKLRGKESKWEKESDDEQGKRIKRNQTNTFTAGIIRVPCCPVSPLSCRKLHWMQSIFDKVFSRTSIFLRYKYFYTGCKVFLKTNILKNM